MSNRKKNQYREIYKVRISFSQRKKPDSLIIQFCSFYFVHIISALQFLSGNVQKKWNKKNDSYAEEKNVW